MVMTPGQKRTLVRHAITLDLVVVATGVAFFFHNPLAVAGAFLAAVALSAWIGQEELGLVATGYSVIILALVFQDLIEPDTLTAFAITGAILSMFVWAVRQVPARAAAEAERAPETVAAAAPAALPFVFGLPLLVLVIYTDMSDALMRIYRIPSLLQPTIALLIVVAWKHRKELRPRQAILQTVTLLWALFVFVNFTTTIWALDLPLADGRFGETFKAMVICALVATLAATWNQLRIAMRVLALTAIFFSIISIIQVLTGHLADVLGGLIFVDPGQIYADVSGARASGPPVRDPNFYGRILLITIPLAVAMGVVQKTRMRRLLWYAGAAVISVGTLVTYSRGDMIALAAMGALFLVAARVRPMKIVAGVLAASVLLMFLPDAIEKRLSTLEVLVPGMKGDAVKDSSVELRKLFGRSAIEMFRQHPLSGVGAGNFGRQYFVYSNIVGSTAYNYEPAGTTSFPHSQWLEIASETGVLGLVPFAATLAAALASLFRSRRILLARGEESRAVLATALMIALCGYMVASVVLHDTHLRYLGIYLGFITATSRLTRARPGDVTGPALPLPATVV